MSCWLCGLPIQVRQIVIELLTFDPLLHPEILGLLRCLNVALRNLVVVILQLRQILKLLAHVLSCVVVWLLWSPFVQNRISLRSVVQIDHAWVVHLRLAHDERARLVHRLVVLSPHVILRKFLRLLHLLLVGLHAVFAENALLLEVTVIYNLGSLRFSVCSVGEGSFLVFARTTFNWGMGVLWQKSIFNLSLIVLF